MNSDTIQNSRLEARTSSLPERRKTLDGSSATFIIAETAPKNSPGNLKRTCLHLGDADREAIEKIRQELELPSAALAVRLAIRKLAERLAQKSILADTRRGSNDRIL